MSLHAFARATFWLYLFTACLTIGLTVSPLIAVVLFTAAIAIDWRWPL